MRSLVCLLGLGLLLVPAASAAPGHTAVAFDLPAQASGAASASALGSMYASGEAGALQLTLANVAGHATRVVHRAFGLDSSNPDAQVLVQGKTEFIPVDMTGATLRIDSRDATFQLLATGQARLAPQGTDASSTPLLVGALQDDQRVSYELQPPVSVQFGLQPKDGQFERTLQAGSLQARALDASATLDGPIELFVSGATASLHSAAGTQLLNLRAYTTMASGSLYNPATGHWSGPGSHPEHVQEYLLVEAQASHLELRTQASPAFLYASQTTLAGTGTLILPAAKGTVTVEGKDASGHPQTTTHTLHGEDLALDGKYDLHLTKDPADLRHASATGDGDYTSVRYGATRATYPWGPVAAAVGIGAALLAAGVWLATQGKLLGGSAAAGILGYARVHGEEILSHPGRHEVYERVKAQPGISFHLLAEQVTFGASTLTYHLRVLEKNEFVTSLRDGRYLRFFDRKAGTYAGDKKQAVMVIRNPATNAIAKHIRDHPGVAQHELAAKFDVTASTVSWHVKRLTQVGLVDARRTHPHTRYYAGTAWATMPAQEVEAMVVA